MTTPTPDRRTQMLADATTERDQIAADLAKAQTEKDKLRDELERITDEMKGRIRAAGATVTDLNGQLADAEDLVKALTPRTRKPRTTPANVVEAALLLGGHADVDDEPGKP